MSGAFWNGVLASLIGIFAGATISAGRDWWRERQTIRRVANAISTEILAQADAVATCGSLVNFSEFELKRDENLNTIMLASILPPEPTIYRSLASQLALLETATVSAIVAFYGSVDLAKSRSTQYTGEKIIPTDFLPILGAQWRAAARNALAASQRTGKSLRVANEKEYTRVKDVVTALADVVDKKWPRVRRNPQSGNFEIR